MKLLLHAPKHHYVHDQLQRRGMYQVLAMGLYDCDVRAKSAWRWMIVMQLTVGDACGGWFVLFMEGDLYELQFQTCWMNRRMYGLTLVYCDVFHLSTSLVVGFRSSLSSLT